MASTAERPPPSTLPATVKRSSPEPLAIVELLENILRFLPMRDLLFAQRVCKRWHALISHSKQLQRALYLLPDPNPSYLMPLFNPNPVLVSAFASYIHIRPRNAYFPQSRQLVDENRFRKDLHHEIILKSTTKAWEQRFMRKEASWRRMLLTQPPVVDVLVMDERIAPDYEDCFAEWARNLEGVTMGQLLFLEEKEVG